MIVPEPSAWPWLPTGCVILTTPGPTCWIARMDSSSTVGTALLAAGEALAAALAPAADGLAEAEGAAAVEAGTEAAGTDAAGLAAADPAVEAAGVVGTPVLAAA